MLLTVLSYAMIIIFMYVIMKRKCLHLLPL